MARTDYLNALSAQSSGSISRTFASVSPVANSLVVAVIAVINRYADVRGALTVSGGGLEWTRRVNSGETDSSYYVALEVWTAPTGSSPAALALNVAAALTAAECTATVHIFSWPNTDVDISNPYVQNGTATGISALDAYSFNLGAAPSASSYLVAARYIIPSDTTVYAATEGTGWTEIYDGIDSSGYGQLESQTITGVTSASVSWQDIAISNSAYYFNGSAVALEIRGVASGPQSYSYTTVGGAIAGGSVVPANAPTIGSHAQGVIKLSDSVLSRTTAARSVNSGSYIVAFTTYGYSQYQGESPLSDSTGNTFSKLATDINYAPEYSDAEAQIFGSASVTGSVSYTMTDTLVSADESTFAFVEVRGGTSVDGSISRVQRSATNAVSITCTGPAVLVAATHGWGTESAAPSVSAGWTILEDYNASDGASIQQTVAAREVSSAGTYTCTFTLTPTQSYANLFGIAIKGAAAGATSYSYTAVGGALAGGSVNARGHIPGVVFEAAGTVAYSAANGTSVTPGYPTMTAGNPYDDALVAFVHQKPSTANSGTVTTPSGWTLLGSITGAGGYSTTIGADTGNTNLFVYRKDTVTGSESGTLSITVGTNSVSAAQIHRISKQGSGAWQFAVATGSRNASANGTVAVQMSTDPGITVGDLLIGYFGIPTDVTTPSQFTSESFSATGITTWGTIAEVNEPDSGNGNDIGGVVIQNRVLAGTSSAAPYFNATAGGTTTNVRGPIAILRAREATTQTSSYTTVGGALSGGAAAEERTWLQAVAGGAIAGAAAAMKRSVVAAVAAGAIAGGSASVATATATGLSYTAIGGAICGGAAAATQVRTRTAAGGALVGGSVSETRVASRIASGGAVAAGVAAYTRSLRVSGAAGAISGGAATESRTVRSAVAGGALVGGTATVTINATSVLTFTAVGGAIAGGAVVEKRASRWIVTGGCVAGASATERRTVIITASGGAITGGVAGKLETKRIAATGGALAGGSTIERRAAVRATAGGSIAGAVARTLQLRTWTPTSGAIAGGEAPWASSAPKSYYHEGDGGAAAGGVAQVVTLKRAAVSGGALIGGTAAISRGKTFYVAGGALAGGAAAEQLIGVRRATGGSVVGGTTRVTVATSRAPIGGALAGGAAAIVEIQTGVLAYTARGGALSGGIATVASQYVAPLVVNIPASIRAVEFALYSVEKSTQEPMRPIYVGDTIPLVFETKALNGNVTGRLYDPTHLVVTIRFEPSGRTDSITYGGSEPSNVYLTRLSVGRYQLLYPAGSVDGYAWIEARVSEDVAGVAYVADMLAPVRVLIRPLKTGHVDAPASV